MRTWPAAAVAAVVLLAVATGSAVDAVRYMYVPADAQTPGPAYSQLGTARA